MAGLDITFRMDLTGLLSWATPIIERELRQAIRAGVNVTAAKARKNFLRSAAADIGVKQSDIRPFVSPVSRAGTRNLSASFVAKNTGFTRTPRLVRMARGNQYKEGGGEVKTFLTSGGGSNPLSSKKLFMLESNGGRVVMVRQGRKLKRIYAEGPGSAAGLESAKPHRELVIATPTMLKDELNPRIAAVLQGRSASFEYEVDP